MAKAKNKVISGDYKGHKVLSIGSTPMIKQLLLNTFLDGSTVSSYQLVDEQQQKSAVSGFGRGVVGSVVGPVGALAGVMSAKSKGVYRVSITFHDGKRSLLEVDDHLYRLIISSCF